MNSFGKCTSSGERSRERGKDAVPCMTKNLECYNIRMRVGNIKESMIIIVLIIRIGSFPQQGIRS
jgi:hypothetical protein